MVHSPRPCILGKSSDHCVQARAGGCLTAYFFSMWRNSATRFDRACVSYFPKEVVRFEDPGHAQEMLQHFFATGPVHKPGIDGIFFPDLLKIGCVGFFRRTEDAEISIGKRFTS